jgi:hypothetical protein
LLDALQRDIAKCSPVLWHGDLTSDLTEKLRGVPDATPEKIGSIVRTLFSIYGSSRSDGGMTGAQAAADAAATMQRDGKLGTPAEGWGPFEKRLAEFLSDDRVLGISAKAWSVTAETQRHVHGFRVLTDARPIFGQNVSEAPKAFSLIHTLQVEYFEEGKEREWFVSLDADDLEVLQGAVERAIAKERSVRTMLEKLGVPVLSWKADGSGK